MFVALDNFDLKGLFGTVLKSPVGKWTLAEMMCYFRIVTKVHQTLLSIFRGGVAQRVERLTFDRWRPVSRGF